MVIEQKSVLGDIISFNPHDIPIKISWGSFHFFTDWGSLKFMICPKLVEPEFEPVSTTSI